MKILCISDNEIRELYEGWTDVTAGRLSDIGLVLSAGDLAPWYLEFIVTMLNVPLFYVRGNHDSVYDERPPEGCVDIDDKVVDVCGLRIAGLGGSIRYKEGPDMFTEAEMGSRVRRLRGSMLIKNIISRRPLDILLTHSPCYGHGDMPDNAHRGFSCFNEVLMDLRPAYHIYGHVHTEYGRIERESTHPAGTREINVSGMYILDIENEVNRYGAAKPEDTDGK